MGQRGVMTDAALLAFNSANQNQSLSAPFGSLRVKIQTTTRYFSSSGRQRLKVKVWESPLTRALDSYAG